MIFLSSFVSFAFHFVVVLFLSLSPCNGDIPCCPSALTTVSVNSTLPPGGSPGVGVTASLLKSYNGTYVFELSSWKESDPESNTLTYCMAAVMNTKISPGSQIWAANNAIPLEAANGCILKLSEDGDFSLQVNGNSTAWHTNTGGKGVQNLSLEETGNLVLQDTKGRIIWQSFAQSPIFQLQSGMKFTRNTVLFSFIPATDQSGSDFSIAGKYGMEMNEHGRLVMYANVEGSQFVYWSSGSVSNSNKTVDYVAIEDAVIFYDNQNVAVGEISPSSNAPLQRGTVRTAFIENQSGNLLAFARSTDTWRLFYNSSIGACENPAYCGEFNLCDPATSKCTCPSGFTTIGSQPGADCEPSSQTDATVGNITDCSLKDYQFVEVYVSFPPQLSALSAGSPDECQKSCAENCSTCNAALYDSTTRLCSLFSTLQTVPTKGENSSQVLFLKILTPKHSKEGTVIRVVLGILAAFGLISLFVAFLYGPRSCWRRSGTDELFLSALPRLPPRFDYGDLQSATKEFSTKIGAGGFGSVYEGILPSGARVAVKKLEGGAGQSSDQFRAEVATIGSVSHMNLVSLKGFCMEGEARLLVYEHIANGSLDKWLFRSSSASNDVSRVLDWETRCRIASDTARGLAYLHHELGERIVHCDVKPENILLDEGFNAKVADFGLAKLMGGGDESFAMTTLKGTRGYLAPEWLRDATITAKSDVYSYGVVLLELVTGRRCIDGEGEYLPTWASHVMSAAASQASRHTNASSLNTYDPKDTSMVVNDGKDMVEVVGSAQSGITTLLDERLHQRVPLASLENLVCIALSCLRSNPIARPSMADVVQMLDGLLPIPPPLLHSPSIDLNPHLLHSLSIKLDSSSIASTTPSSSQVGVLPTTTSNHESLPSTPSSWLLATPFPTC